MENNSENTKRTDRSVLHTRKKSNSGMYHVMLRGNNKQVIFESEKDYLKFQQLLYQKCHPQDSDHSPLPPCCVLFAYCLMPNHVHLLIQEKKETVSDVIKSVALSFAQYYNIKYGHSGHLFQSRFRSEPVDDWDYFVTLLRYIHQNPVAGGLAACVKDYRWSSWAEFENKAICNICATGSVLSRISRDALTELVNEPMPKARRILDFNNESSIRIGDDVIREFIRKDCAVPNPNDLQAYPKTERQAILKRIREFGGSIRQISRITGISESFVRKAE